MALHSVWAAPLRPEMAYDTISLPVRHRGVATRRTSVIHARICLPHENFLIVGAGTTSGRRVGCGPPPPASAANRWAASAGDIARRGLNGSPHVDAIGTVRFVAEHTSPIMWHDRGRPFSATVR